MKKISILFFIILFIVNTTFSQHSVKVFVLDSALKTPINSVEIGNKFGFTTIYSGFDGSFTVSFEKESVFLQLKHLSYKPKSIKITKFDKSPKYVYLSRNNFSINEIVVSASQSNETKNSTPYLLSTISNSENKKNIILSADDYLQNSSTFNISRPQGIYSNSPIVTSNGMGGVPGRTLVMFDGISLNKADDGNVNWNMLSSSNIAKVEIINNSASTIYGNNAMGGAINFIAKRPEKTGLKFTINSFAGTYNTFGAEFNISDKHRRQKGIYFNLNAFSQMSDGYIPVPDSLQDKNIEYIPTYLTEIKANLLLGYDFNLNNKLEIIYNFHDDERGLGEKINEENGSFTEHNSHLLIAKYKGNAKKINWGVNFYGQNENYFKVIENLKNSNYSLIYVDSKRQDAGTNLFLNYKPTHKIKFTTGINIKYGSVESKDIYQTSTDIVVNKGNLYSAEGFLQTKISPLNNNNLHLLFGANYNQTYLKDVEFYLENETSATDFMSDFTGKFDDNSFENFAFNSGFRYNLNKFSLWTSFNSGYNSPTLDDLTRSGLNRYGFKLANPNLHSEQMYNTNYGFGYFSKTINLNFNGNYNIGNDFLYYIETGDAIFGGNKKIIQKQNITQVEIYNFNVDFNYKLKNFELFANYSFNNSKIISFDSIPELIGKELMYSPNYKANAGILLRLNQYDFSLIGHYTSKQFTNNENTEKILSYYTFDFKVSTQLFKKLELGLGIQNVLDYQYLVYYDQLSIGRFMMFNIRYSF